jgi:ABC transporter substrate binding protein (PQQ-dependent alcohol dehydrogenase system)
LSIQQLEERKKADEERKKAREKRGKKTFQKEISITTDIVFVSKEREVPPVLSNLDPVLEDEGFYGVKLALEDNLTTGRFLGHDYKVEFHRILLEEDLVSEFEKLLKKGKKYFVVDLNESELLSLMKLSGIDDVLIFNTRAKNDSLRNENCKKNFFHITPSYSILSDALTQYLVKKKWKKWFLVTGPKENDRLYAQALKSSAKKFNIKIKEEKNLGLYFRFKKNSWKRGSYFHKRFKL